MGSNNQRTAAIPGGDPDREQIVRKTFYDRLQWIALLPMVAFVWSGLADVSLGWAGTLPLPLDSAEPLAALTVVCATVLEAVAPIGLLFSRTRTAAALILCAYVLLAGLNAYAVNDSADWVQLQPLARMVAMSGALLFAFAATQAQRVSDRRRD
jgi:uncharacterized membrane protein YphA (DoxX/SURF4 family)